MSGNQRLHKLLLAGALAVGCFALLVQSKAAISKRASESLYDNIYEAISEFTEEELNDANLPAKRRSSRRAQGGGQFNRALAPQAQPLPRAGRQGGTRQVIVDGFPTGLPDGTPRGVQIALASMVDTGEMPPIPGQAGVDYPTLTTVPDTGFDCNAQTYPGIYGDPGADCQVFWMCQPNGNFNGFLCPNGTIFNQQYFICDWWYNSDCGNIQSFYGLNEFIYQDQPEGFLFSGADNGVDNSAGSASVSGGFSGGNGASFSGSNGNVGGGNIGNFGRGSGGNVGGFSGGNGGGNGGNRGGNRQNGGGNRGNGGGNRGNGGGRRQNNNNGGGALSSYGAPGK